MRAVTRLFTAIDLPEAAKDQLELLRRGIPRARWTKDRQYHLTLRFLGEVEGPAVELVHEVLRGVRAAPFELRLEGTGHFPPRGRPRVLWAGVAPEPRLDELQRRVEKAVRRAGLPGEERRFAAHVSLARLDDAPLPRLLDFLRDHAHFAAEPFPVERFHLYSSVLGREGSLHTVLESFPLQAERAVDVDLPPPARLS
jgi:2'-5' RNA ligase